MGLFKSIGKAFKSVGKALGGVVKGVAKFAKSPFGKLLINVGLSFITGGTGGLLAKALGALGGSSLGGLVSKVAGGGLSKLFSGGLSNIFQGFAGKFLSQATDYLSKSGLASVAGFLQKAGTSGDLLSLAKSISAATQDAKTDQTTAEVVRANLVQLFAQRAAAQLTAA